MIANLFSSLLKQKTRVGPLSLRANFSWSFLGNFTYRCSQWGVLVLLAKLTPPEVVGRFAIGLAISAPVILLTNMQLRNIQATDAISEYHFYDYLSLRLVMLLIALVIITIIICTTGYNKETVKIIFLISFTKIIESVSDVFYGLFQQNERMDRIAVSMMIKGPLSLISLGCIVYFTRSLSFGIIGLIMVWIFLLVFYDIPKGILILRSKDRKQSQVNNEVVKIKFKFRFTVIGRLFKLAVPLGIVMMLISLNRNIPNYAVDHFLGEGELGIFATIAYFITAGSMIVMALGQSAMPRLSKYYNCSNKKAYLNLLIKLFILGLLIGISGVVFSLIGGKTFLTIIYKPEYADHAKLFVWIMIAGGFSYVASFLGYGMTAARYFNVQLPLFVFVTACSAVSCWFLIPKFGLTGVAFSLIVSYFAQLLGSGFIIAHALRKIKVST